MVQMKQRQVQNRTRPMNHFLAGLSPGGAAACHPAFIPNPGNAVAHRPEEEYAAYCDKILKSLNRIRTKGAQK